MNHHSLEPDFGQDYLIWLNKIDNINADNKRQLEKLKDEIISKNDAPMAYFFAAEFNYQTYLMQKIVIEQADPRYAFLFAQNIPLCDIKAMQKIVVKSNNIEYICKFACYVSGANLSTLEAAILKAGKAKYAHIYLKNVDSTKINKFKEIVFLSGKPRYLYELAKHTSEPDDIGKIEDLIIKSRSFTYMRLLAENIELANVEKIEQAILDSGNSDEIKRFAENVKEVKCDNSFWCYEKGPVLSEPFVMNLSSAKPPNALARGNWQSFQNRIQCRICPSPFLLGFINEILN